MAARQNLILYYNLDTQIQLNVEVTSIIDDITHDFNNFAMPTMDKTSDPNNTVFDLRKIVSIMQIKGYITTDTRSVPNIPVDDVATSLRTMIKKGGYIGLFNADTTRFRSGKWVLQNVRIISDTKNEYEVSPDKYYVEIMVMFVTSISGIGI